ncbi:hypothetical protein OG369_43070 [Streptomyces sp. NBC_01221]|uniref:hypothetical protein n=1 Tax=Streptomyces sp. NBC_01221 TaxID=2903782 RepID=UPI002250159C|nr:hypothetical protein [Streptomyces sp. NBC_01221]MCX4792560.1 hypothetical protein [Streptomyces sp. NBC_01221]
MAEAPDQTYLVILGAALAQANINALILAENGDNQLGWAYPGHPGYRNWDGNLISVGHHDKNTFALEVDAILPAHMSVVVTDHRYARLDEGTWTRCPANADGAVPITVALARIHDQDEEVTR